MPPGIPTWLLFIVLLLPAAGVVALQCEPPETDFQFYDKCSSRNEDLCIPGERLKYSQTDCPDEYIMQCVPCEPGTFMPGYNFCEECRPKIPCEDGEVEVPSSRLGTGDTKDRTCEPAPVSSQSPECTPCPAPSACQSPLPSEPYPTCPTTMCPDPDETTPSTSSTPTNKNSTENTQPEPRSQCDGGVWIYVAIPLLVLFALEIFIALGWCLCYLSRSRSRSNSKRKDPDNNDKEEDEENDVSFNKQNGVNLSSSRGDDVRVDDVRVDVCVDDVCVDVTNMQQSGESNDFTGSRNGSCSLSESASQSDVSFKAQNGVNPSSSRSDAVRVDTTNMQQSWESNDFSGSRNGSCSLSESASQSGVLLLNPENQHSLANEQSGKEVTPENKGNSQVGKKGKPIKRHYNTSEDTPSMQPLLEVQSIENSPSGSLPNQAFQRSILQQPSTSEHGEGSVQDLSNKQPDSDFVHNMETAEYQQPSVNGDKTLWAWESEENKCGITETCNDKHIDFVHDEISIDTRYRFYFKLGIKPKDYKDIEYDYKSEKIRTVILEVLLKWERNYDHPIKTLVKALEESGNKKVSIEFKKKFHVQ